MQRSVSSGAAWLASDKAVVKTRSKDFMRCVYRSEIALFGHGNRVKAISKPMPSMVTRFVAYELGLWAAER